MCREDRRRRQILDRVHDRQQPVPQLPAALGGEAIEDVDVHAAADHLAPGADQKPARALGHHLPHRLLERVDQLVVEEVQRRVIYREDRERSVGFDRDRRHPAEPIASAAPVRSSDAGGS